MALSGGQGVGPEALQGGEPPRLSLSWMVGASGHLLLLRASSSGQARALLSIITRHPCDPSWGKPSVWASLAHTILTPKPKPTRVQEGL